ncbi:MAG: rhomboid family intramembrane serine protease [Gammaproteobacteria bacterium]|nr:rhomboid family intramembrane serine protease [Gammaproteobacteria bacterium]
MVTFSYKVIETSLEEDLAEFSLVLSSFSLPHRFSETGVSQILWVSRLEDVRKAHVLYENYSNGGIEFLDSKARTKVKSEFGLKAVKLIRSYPVTSMVIALTSLFFFPSTSSLSVEEGGFISRLLFSPVLYVEGLVYLGSLDALTKSGEWWRLITPMFIHFGWLHLVLNLLWFLELGHKIEMEKGSFFFACLILVSSLIANLGQYLLFGASIFGGLSGVVYGLLGYCLVWSFFVPVRAIELPKGVYIFMLVFLLLGFGGVIDLLGFGRIANGSHLGGLLAGIILGALSGMIFRARSSN